MRHPTGVLDIRGYFAPIIPASLVVDWERSGSAVCLFSVASVRHRQRFSRPIVDVGSPDCSPSQKQSGLSLP
jgi:hypothetical protein